MSDKGDRSESASEMFERASRDAHARRVAAAAGPAPRVPGICTGCDEPIDPERLAAKPDARRCISCQEEQDFLDRHRRR